MRELNFVTGNTYKYTVLAHLFKMHQVQLNQIDLDTPEIQSTELKEIAEYSARWVVEKVGEPLLVNDSGYFILGLNGFPGAFVKYVCQQLTAKDWLRLMSGVTDRRLMVKTATTMIVPGKDPITFEHESVGIIAHKAGRKMHHSLNQIFIPDGYEKVFTELSEKDQMAVWKRDLNLEGDISVIKKYLETV